MTGLKSKSSRRNGLIGLLSLSCALQAKAQDSTAGAGSPTGTLVYNNPSGYSTKIYDVSAATATIKYSYTNEELGLLWDQVGKIEVGNITTTVQPTPEPTSYPRPGIFHGLVRESTCEVLLAKQEKN